MAVLEWLRNKKSPYNKSVDELVDAESEEESPLPSPVHIAKFGIAAVAGIAAIGAAALLYALTSPGCSRQAKQPSALERYQALPTTNVTAMPGDTMNGLIYRHAGDFKGGLGAMQYVFMTENGNNGEISSNKTYKVHVSTNYSPKTKLNGEETNFFKF